MENAHNPTKKSRRRRVSETQSTFRPRLVSMKLTTTAELF